MSSRQRVLSGMRPTGALHLGHYHGVLKNWLNLQAKYECFFFIADWHALTTEYAEPGAISANILELVIDWLAVGVNPNMAKLFIQSRIPEHAELHLLLSMSTPLSWLERVPSYKDQQVHLKDKDLSTYGFLGYPLLQSADILLYHSQYVPVGEDQLAHIELTREVARRFNFLYGREPDFVDNAMLSASKLGKKKQRFYLNFRRDFQERGDVEALSQGRELVRTHHNLSIGDKGRLYAYLAGEGRVILPEPQALLTETAKMPGLDGKKMSKSYGNAIALREKPAVITEKLKTMQTDPARVRRHDPGDPNKCPVWEWHQIYSDKDLKESIKTGCTTASIGCLECKHYLIDAVLLDLAPIRERAKEYQQDIQKIQAIVNEGCEAAREVARGTMSEVRAAIGIAQS